MSEDETECNLPFERVPMCACDKGTGEQPTKLMMLECRARGGPCSNQYYDNPDNNIPDGAATKNLPALPPQPIPPDLVKQMAMDIGKEIAAYIERMYPKAVEATSSTFLLSVRNSIYNEIIAAIGTSDAKEIEERLATRKRFRRKLRATWKAIRKMTPGDGSPEAVSKGMDIINGRIPLEPDL